MELKRHVIPYFLGIIILFSVSIGYPEELPGLLILSPEGEIFGQTIQGMEGEFDNSFIINKMEISKETTESQISSKINLLKPAAVILMGNRTIRLYKNYLKDHSGKNDTIPVVALMASQVEKAVSPISSVQSIGYETPMITALLNFRNIIGKEIDNVGVIYRSVYGPFIEKHRQFCKKEKISVKGMMVGDDEKKYNKEIKKALKHLVQKEKVDVFWIPNDNRLLTAELLTTVWIPYFNKYKVPVIVGVESLVKKEIHFGTYAVIPEPTAIGEQAAEIIFNLQENGWKFDSNMVYPAISVYSVLNLSRLANIAPETLNLNEVSKVLK